MKIVEKKISEINMAPYNPRVKLMPGMPEYQKLKDSIDQFGLVKPIVWNKRTNNLVGGHQRVYILKDCGAKTVPVSVVDLDEIREKQLNIALNKAEGEWDEEKLKNLLADLGEDALKTGFSEDELFCLGQRLDDYMNEELLEIEEKRMPKTFTITLEFPIDKNEVVSDYIKTVGKEFIVKLIIEKICSEVEQQ